MATQILEGTFTEVMQKMNSLHIKPEKHVCLIWEEEAEQEQPDLKGIRLFPVTDPGRTITTEEVLEIISRIEDEEYENLSS